MVLPCSKEMALAKSFACSSSNALNLNIMRARRNAGVADQAGKAACAAAIAAFVSSAVAMEICDCTAPVAGLYTSPNRLPVPAMCLPLM